MATITTLGFDADDTLWHNETIFAESHRRYCELLAHYHDADTVEATLFKTEMRNLKLLGYGVKSHALCAIETAIDLTEGNIKGEEIRSIIDIAKDMLHQPVELLDGVEEVVSALAEDYRLVLITKGDLLDQERKIEASGIAQYFSDTEVVSEKNPETYDRLFKRLDVSVNRFAMTGNSLKSDIIPILQLGGFGFHVPYHITWAAELSEQPEAKHGPRYRQLENIREVQTALSGLG
jgi:putative hydrolase of the HAD superfamily